MSTNTDVLHAGVCSDREENIHECVLESSLKCSSEHHTETQLAIAQNDALHRHERERETAATSGCLCSSVQRKQRIVFRGYNDAGVIDRKCVSNIMADV